MASDHYIPRFYLKHFQIPNREGWIYSYKRETKPKALGIRSVACEENFYTLTSANVTVPRDTPDQFYKDVETAAAPIIKRLLTSSKLALSDKEHLTLAIFIGYLAQRTPFARQKALNIHTAFFKKKLQHLAQNKEEFLHVVVDELKLADTEKAEQYRQSYLHPDKNFTFSLKGDTEDFSLQRVFKAAEFLTNMLLPKHLVLVEAPPSDFFITSDNPFLVLVPKPYIRGMEVSPVNADCLFPISPHRALLFSNTLQHNGVYRIGKKRMANWLSQFIWFGYERLFASFSSDSIQAEFDRVPAGKIAEMPLWGVPPLPPLRQ